MSALAGRASADSLAQALALVPAEAEAVFVVPDLKRASDELQSCLERAERAETSLVGRPIDLLKAMLGVPVGVRDDGSLVGFVRWPADREAPILALLVPVTDPGRFLEDNFEVLERQAGRPPRLVRRGGESPLHAGVIGDEPRRWVALSPDLEGVSGLAVDPARAAALLRELGASPDPDPSPDAAGPGDRLLRGAEVVAWVRGEGLRRSLKAAAAQQAARNPGGPEVPEGAGPLLDAVQLAAMAWNIDSLGLLGRGLMVLDPGHEVTAAFKGGRRGVERAKGRRLGLLPGQPCYLALGVDLQGLGGPEALAALASALPGAAGGAPVLEGVDEFQIAIYPSKLGIAVGGVLNDAAMVLRASRPSALRDRLRSRLESMQGERGGFRRSLVWESDRPVKDGVTADAFELEQTALTGSAAPDVMTSLMFSIVLGSRGFHGFAKPVDDRSVLVATFSQRPDVWRRAVAAATGEGALLGDGGAVAAMRRFAGVDDADVEMVVGITQLVRLAQQIAKMVPGGEEAVPSLDAGTEPIYAALEVDDARIEGAVVIPSAAVGLVIDRLRRMGLER